MMGEGVARPGAQEEGQGVGGGGAAPKRQRLMGSYATLAVTGGAQVRIRVRFSGRGCQKVRIRLRARRCSGKEWAQAECQVLGSGLG